MKLQTLFPAIVFLPTMAYAQQDLNPAYQHAVPDKAFEIGIPVLLILALLYTVVAIFRIVTENKIRQRLIDKGVSDEALKQMLMNGSKRITLEALKWGLVISFTGIGLFICQFFTFGYVTFAVLSLCIAIGLLIFSSIARQQ